MQLAHKPPRIINEKGKVAAPRDRRGKYVGLPYQNMRLVDNWLWVLEFV